jgi:hypothetical protein
MWLPSDEEARSIIDRHCGLVSNWFRNVGEISPPQIRDKLTLQNLDLHINHFDSLDPATGEAFSKNTPFISLMAGTVERDVAAQTNMVRSALQTALWFGSDFGKQDVAYVYRCWMVVAPRSCVEIEGVAEEIRDLNTYRRYSAFQTEGEIAAKVWVPDNHIENCKKWTWGGRPRRLREGWTHPNPRFTPPAALSNVKDLI